MNCYFINYHHYLHEIRHDYVQESNLQLLTHEIRQFDAEMLAIVSCKCFTIVRSGIIYLLYLGFYGHQYLAENLKYIIYYIAHMLV